MASSPRWKVYNSEGTYVGAVKEAEAAAHLVSFYGEGATIRDFHGPIVWAEGDGAGRDGRAAESFDGTAHLMYQRVHQRNMARYNAAYGAGAAEAVLGRAEGGA